MNEEKTITAKQFKNMAVAITQIIKGEKPACSYRRMIYGYGGLGKDMYSPLYPEVLLLTNALVELEEELDELRQFKAKYEKLAEDLYLAYKNKDPDCPHEFEKKAVKDYLTLKGGEE